MGTTIQSANVIPWIYVNLHEIHFDLMDGRNVVWIIR